MLQGELYTIVQADAAGVELRLLPESRIYAAHFPGFPITPGVVLIQVAVELLAQVYGVKTALPQVPMAKFVSPVLPSADKPLFYRFTPSGETAWKVDIHYDNVPSARLTLDFPQ